MTKPILTPERFPDGVYDAIPFATYCLIERVHFSTLKLMKDSAAHYKHGVEHPRKDTAALAFGRAVHTSVLEPERFPLEYVVFSGDKRKKEWKAFQAVNSDKQIVTEAEYEDCLAIGKAVRAHPLAAPYLAEGAVEKTILYTHAATGIKCKCRIDKDSPLATVDLKTTANPRPWAFERDAYKYRYRTQGAMYNDAERGVSGGEKPHVIIAIEKDAPHQPLVYEIPEESLERGREEYGHWLERLAGCREHDVWPFEFVDEVRELWEPSWALDEDEGPTVTVGGKPMF